MTSAVARNDPGVQNLDLRIERHMGCMAGFLHLFDRSPNNLAGKRHYASPKRLPFSSPVVGSTSPSEKSDASSSSSSTFNPCPLSPARKEAEAPRRSSLPPPVFDFKERTRSAWGFRESPRLSLDSRAIVDAKGKLQPREIRTTCSDELADDQQRRSPSIVARLMGLDALSDAGSGGGLETPSRRGAELQRSSSESRASRDPSGFRFVDPSSFQKYPPPELKSELRCRDLKPKASLPLVRENKRQEFYPEQKRTGSVYGETERRLKVRGIDEPAPKGFETLKGLLLHSKLPLEPQGLRRNCPPIVVLKPAPRPPRQPARAPPSPPRSRRPPPPASARRDPQGWNRGSQERSPTSPARRRLFNGREAPKLAPPPTRRRESPTPAPYSPKTSPRRIAPDPISPKSSRVRRPPSPIIPPPVEDAASTTSISESSVRNSSGRSLLERCDRLLYSIAAVTSSASAAAADQQPSPVSVLDRSPFFFGEESSPPSRMRSIDFRDRFADWEEDLSTPTCLNGHVEDEDLAYVSKVLRALRDPLKDPSDVYVTLEKRRRHGVPGPSRAHRRMLFDVVAEFVDRKRSVAPWDAFASGAAVGGSAALLREVWAEVRRTTEQVATAEDYLNDVTREAIRKDMAVEDRGWEVACPVAIPDAVLDVERRIFKDLVAEAIRDFADVDTAGGGSTCRQCVPRRKLLF